MTIEGLSDRPTSAMSERELTRGYSRARDAVAMCTGCGSFPCRCHGTTVALVRNERCAFDGGVITAPASDHRAIEIAVVAHNASTAHEQAATRRGLR